MKLNQTNLHCFVENIYIYIKCNPWRCVKCNKRPKALKLQIEGLVTCLLHSRSNELRDTGDWLGLTLGSLWLTFLRFLLILFLISVDWHIFATLDFGFVIFERPSMTNPYIPGSNRFRQKELFSERRSGLRFSSPLGY